MGDDEFGVLLHRYRLAAGLTQEELASRAELSARTISNLESGRTVRPFRRSVQQLTMALGLEGQAAENLAAAGTARPGMVNGSDAEYGASGPARPGAAAGLGRGCTAFGKVVVEVFGDVGGQCIADESKGADDVLVAGEVEVFVGETRVDKGGVAGGQVCQITVQVQCADVGDGQRSNVVIAKDQTAAGRVLQVGITVACEVCLCRTKTRP
jgi:transcriptional regulator with XRE-family HTH domain